MITTTLIKNSATLNIRSETSQSHTSYVSQKCVPIYLMTSSKSNEYLNSFIKQVRNCSELKVLTNDMPTKTHDEFLLQNQKNPNGKTIIVTTWHPALEHLFQILREKCHQHIENHIYL